MYYHSLYVHHIVAFVISIIGLSYPAYATVHAPVYNHAISYDSDSLQAGLWPAAWISAPNTDIPLPLFRRGFTVDKPVVNATVRATALGSYRLSINGVRVGQDILTPDWTDYSKRVTYQTYDVTTLVTHGENVIGALLGNGWYGGPIGLEHANFPVGQAPIRLSLEMRVTYKDGTESLVRSDETWKTSSGPIVRSEIYDGETYDARRELPGWNRPGFDDKEWRPVRLLPPVTISVMEQQSPTIQATDTLVPKSRISPATGVYIYDLGQNMVGWARLKVRGSAGTTVKLRFAEVLDSTGKNISVLNLRRARSTDIYTLKGDGDEIYEPHFTYHGFRYVEVTGYPTGPSGTPPEDAIRGIVFHTAALFTGRLTTSDSTINQLWSNIMWGQRGNLHSVPTDCPQRDERLGWMADAQVFWRTASYNMDMRSFTRKWMTDVRDGQTEAGCYPNYAPFLPRAKQSDCGAPAWADAGIIVPWVAYHHYGDTAIVNENWAAMERYMGFIRDSNPSFIVTRPADRRQFGDWVPAGSLSSQSLTEPTLIATAYWAYDAQLMAEMARGTGRAAEALRYSALADSIRAKFIAAYVRPDGAVGKLFTTKEGVSSDVTQTSLALALYFNLVPDTIKPKTVARLVKEIESNNWHLTTGFLGTPILLPVLSDNGRDDVAYKLLFQESYPSWFYMIRNGATTMWERWNGDQISNVPGAMNSFNHYAFGAVGEWLYRYMIGIDTDSSDLGFKKIVIRPRPNARLTHARGEYDSAYGTIVSNWTLKNGVFTLTAVLPHNTSGTIVLPNGERHNVGAGEHTYTVLYKECVPTYQGTVGSILIR